MPRIARLAPGGMLFHVLNRGVGRMRLFLKDADFEAFERMIGRTLESRPITHARNWQVYRRRVGYGHLYQGRLKSFPIWRNYRSP